MNVNPDYLPLYAERRCLVCGYWRGQHLGASTDDKEMHCPIDESLVSYFGVSATFLSGAAGAPA